MFAYIWYLWGIVVRLLAALRRRFRKRSSVLPQYRLKEKAPTESDNVIATLRYELAELKAQLEKDRAEVKRMTGVVSYATAEVEKQKAEADKQKASHDKVLVEVREKTAEIKRMKAAMDGCAGLQGKLEGLKGAVEAERKVSAGLRVKLDEQDLLLQARQAELREAQAYSGTIDAVSDMDVVRTVEVLNAEVFQLAAYFAEELDFQDVPPSSIALEDVQDILGAALPELLLGVAKGRCDSFVVQLALQAATIQFASQVVTSWSSEATQHLALQATYEGVFAAETQAISAKWKILTRAHTRHLRPDPDDLKRRFVEILTHVLELAGTRLGTVPDSMIESVRDRVRDIIALAVQLEKHIGEDVVSGDLRVIAPSGGNTFAEDMMEDANGGEGSVVGPGVCVLGATGLGLFRQEKKRRPSEAEGRIIVSVLMKSSVMLDDLLGELMETSEL